MVKENLARHPPAVYNVGETVLVRSMPKDARVKRGGRKLSRSNCSTLSEGYIIKAQPDKYRYLIEVGGKSVWVPVSDLTSTTLKEEKTRHSRGQHQSSQHVCIQNVKITVYIWIFGGWFTTIFSFSFSILIPNIDCIIYNHEGFFLPIRMPTKVNVMSTPVMAERDQEDLCWKKIPVSVLMCNVCNVGHAWPSLCASLPKSQHWGLNAVMW